MDKQTCHNCAHFHQHYALDQKRIFRVYCGHCSFHKIRRKLPDSIACDNYVPSPPDESAFASKEFLSTALVNYLTGLELLPKIEDAPDDKPEKYQK